jgi:hypothetical protein
MTNNQTMRKEFEKKYPFWGRETTDFYWHENSYSVYDLQRNFESFCSGFQAAALAAIPNKQICGTIKLMRSESDDCACCDGNHVFTEYLELDDFKSVFPTHFRRDLDHWLQSVFRFKELDGERIEITAKIINE